MLSKSSEIRMAVESFCVCLCVEIRNLPQKKGLKKLDSVKEAGKTSSGDSCSICEASVEGRRLRAVQRDRAMMKCEQQREMLKLIRTHYLNE